MALIARVLRILLIAFLAGALLSVLAPLMMRLAEHRYIYTAVEEVPQTDAAVVLGASVVHGRPSPILEERAHAAVQLYFSGKVNKILVTGDNGAHSHDEVTPVRKYLADSGVPPKDIFLDHAGFDTYSSMYRARSIYKLSTFTVVTQDFHQPRALFIARSLGVRAYGFDALGNGSLADYVREIPASVKAFFDVATNRTPSYLGSQIPLVGDGTKTWY